MMKMGIIGVASISEQHIRVYLANEGVSLIAFCDINKERLNERGELYGVEQLYIDYKELLENKEIDAVSVCAWNNTHAEIAIAVLEADKHVLMEKPLSMTVKEALAVEETVRKTGKTLHLGFVKRHKNIAKILKEFIDENELGEIYYGKASYLRRLGNPGGWFSDKKRSGGGPLIDFGVHMIDICWYLMGSTPSSIC